MYDNALAAHVLDVLRCRQGLGVHELMAALEQAGVALPVAAEAPEQVLFQKNFLLMNALFELQGVLRQEGWHLHVGTLDIHLEPLPAGETGLPETASALRSYYLDWGNFTTSREEVEALLQGFWQRFAGIEARAESLAVLGLEEGADWPSIRRQYRLLAASHHPDRGGDARRFIEVRAAYDRLRVAAGY